MPKNTLLLSKTKSCKPTCLGSSAFSKNQLGAGVGTGKSMAGALAVVAASAANVWVQ